jgi:hypothetical protein
LFETVEGLDLGRGYARSPTTGREPISKDGSNNRGSKGGSIELTFQLNENRGKDKREVCLVYHM